MPKRIKFYLSIIVAIVALGGYFFQRYLGMDTQSYAALFLGATSIISMWIFPEVTTKKSPSSQAGSQ